MTIFSKLKLDNFDYLLLSILGYNMIYVIGPLLMSKGSCDISKLFFFVVFFITFFKERKTIIYLDKDIRIVLSFFIFWNIYVVVYSLFADFSIRLLLLYIVQPTSFLIYITPCFMLLQYNDERLKKISRWLIVNIIVGLFFYLILHDKINVTSETAIDIAGNLSIFNYLNIAQLPSSCFISAGFLFIYGLFEKRWKVYFLWCSFIIAVVAALLLGRRSSALLPVIIVCAKLFNDLLYRPKFFILTVLCVMGLYCYFSDYILNDFFPSLEILNNRLEADTRSSVENDFYKDMNIMDYIFGRGSEGLVYSSDWGKRPMIETGYLNMILHGGIIYLFLYLYLLCVSAYRGLLCKDKLISSFSYFTIILIVSLYPGGHLTFSLTTFSLWVCVSYCSNMRLRYRTELIKF